MKKLILSVVYNYCDFKLDDQVAALSTGPKIGIATKQCEYLSNSIVKKGILTIIEKVEVTPEDPSTGSDLEIIRAMVSASLDALDSNNIPEARKKLRALERLLYK